MTSLYCHKIVKKSCDSGNKNYVLFIIKKSCGLNIFEYKPTGSEILCREILLTRNGLPATMPCFVYTLQLAPC